MAEKIQREVNRERKVDRVPISGNRDILTVYGKKPGFVYRWVKDVGNRIARFKQAGYELETDPDILVGDARAAVAAPMGSPIIADANLNSNGGEKLYLMRIPEEFYKEDQAAKEANLTAMEAGMGKDVEGSYGKIELSRDK